MDHETFLAAEGEAGIASLSAVEAAQLADDIRNSITSGTIKPWRRTAATKALVACEERCINLRELHERPQPPPEPMIRQEGETEVGYSDRMAGRRILEDETSGVTIGEAGSVWGENLAKELEEQQRLDAAARATKSQEDADAATRAAARRAAGEAW